MNNKPISHYFYDGKPDIVESAQDAFVLPDDTFPQQAQRAEFWTRYRKRQVLWVTARQTVASGKLDKSTEGAAVMAYCKGPGSLPYLEAFEDACFGHLVTRGALADRTQFWHFVGLIFEGIAPSDLRELCDTFALQSEENRRVQAYMAENPLAPSIQSTGKFERLIRKNKGPNSFMRAKEFRRWARVYINAGYPMHYVCQLVPDVYPVVLSQPVPHEEVTLQEGKEFMTLEALKYYFVSHVRDVQKMVRSKKHPPFKTPVATDPAAGYAPVLFQQQMMSAALEMHEGWPQATQARLREMSDRAIWRPGVGFNSDLGFLRKVLDDEETSLFGTTVTTGKSHNRTYFWNAMQCVAMGGKTAKDYSEHRSPYRQTVIDSALGYVLLGHGLEEMAYPLNHGRGGITSPLTVSRYADLAPEEKSSRYQTLAYWIQVSI